MKKVDLDVLKDAANRLLFDMKEEEYLTLLEEFGVLTRQMESIGRIEGLEDYEPMTFPFEMGEVAMRVDEAKKPLGKDEAIGNASSTYMGQIKIAKVVG